MICKYKPDSIPAPWRWPEIRAESLMSDDGYIYVNNSFMDKLSALVVAIKNAGYDIDIIGGGKTGREVKIRAQGGLAYAIITLGAAYGFTGCGLKQTGKQSDRFLTLDDLPDSKEKKRPDLWIVE